MPGRPSNMFASTREAAFQYKQELKAAEEEAAEEAAEAAVEEAAE